MNRISPRLPCYQNADFDDSFVGYGVQARTVDQVAITGTPAGTTTYSAALPDGSAISLTAPESFNRPGKKYTFASWSLDGVDQGDTEPLAFSLEADVTAVANYTESNTFTLTVQSTPVSGAEVTGTPAGKTDYAADLTAGSAVTLTAPIQVTDGGKRYNFTGWSGDYTGANPATVVMDAAKSVTANYAVQQWTLTVASDPTGVSILGAGTYDDQTVVTLDAPDTAEIDAKDYNFVKWTVNGDDVSGNPINVTMDDNKDAVAVYTIQTWTLTVVSDPAGIVDEVQVVEDNTTVTLTTPEQGVVDNQRFNFVNWSTGAETLSIDVTVTADTTATANYEVQTWTLTANSVPAGIVDEVQVVEDNTTVTLTAPEQGVVGGLDYGFIAWVIDGQEQPAGQAVVSFTVSTDRTAVAVYFRARLSVTSSPYSGIYLAGSPAGITPYERVFLAPQEASFSAQLRLFRGSVPYNFAYWKINGIVQQARQTDIQLRVEADTSVEAIYHMLGDANGDCVVNVLDLISIRNRLGAHSDDSWRGDVNLDGSVDVLDLISTRNKLGTRCQ